MDTPTVSDVDENPYRPPDEFSDPDWFEEPDPTARVTCTYARWYRRVFCIETATISGVLRYEPWGYAERAYWNDCLVGRSRVFYPGVGLVDPHFQFAIPHAGRQIPACLDIRMSFLTVNFKLTLDGRCVYIH